MLLRRKKKSSAVRILIMFLTIVLLIQTGFAYPGFGSSASVKEDYLSRYGWDKEKMDEFEWTGDDGKTYERTNEFEASMYDDLHVTVNELAMDLGIITSYADESMEGGLYGSGGYSMLAVARKELEAGVCETPLGSNYTKYHREYGLNPCAWCALFISWCAKECGLVDSGMFQPCECYCGTIFTHMTRDNGFSYFGVSEAECYGGRQKVREGDLVFWYDAGAAMPYSHIGIVSGVSGDSISIISGNQNDRVQESTYYEYSLGYNGSLANGYIVSMQYPSGGGDGIFNFLHQLHGVPVAGAAGIIANLHVETGGTFSPSAYNPNDTDGGASYGICQWHYYTRVNAMRSYCERNYGTWQTLDGQLEFMWQELTGTTGAYRDSKIEAAYPGVMYCENSAYGAESAALQFAINFEQCSSAFYSQRQDLARNTYWPQFK